MLHQCNLQLLMLYARDPPTPTHPPTHTHTYTHTHTQVRERDAEEAARKAERKAEADRMYEKVGGFLLLKIIMPGFQTTVMDVPHVPSN